MEKSKVTPTQNILYFGYKILSVLPEERISNLKQRLSFLQTNPNCIVREVRSALGLMTAAIPVVQWARFHQRVLQRFLSEQVKDKGLEEYISIPTKVKRSLWWWKEKDT